MEPFEYSTYLSMSTIYQTIAISSGNTRKWDMAHSSIIYVYLEKLTCLIWNDKWNYGNIMEYGDTERKN